MSLVRVIILKTRHAHLFWECLRRAGELVARELVHRRLCKCISIRVSVRAYVQVYGRLCKCMGVRVSTWEPVAWELVLGSQC